MSDQPAPVPDTPPEQPEPEVPDNDGADYEAASRSTADFVKNVAPLQAQKKRRKKGRIIIAVILLLLIAGGAAGYFLFLKPEKKDETAQQQEPELNPTEQADTSPLEHYVSQELKLALDHPSSWKIDNATSGQIKLESPVAKLTDGSGAQTDAKVTITILGANASLASFKGNSAQAVIESEKIAYASPTQNQRKETYLSFAGFDSSTAVDAVYITGDKGYQKGQTIPKTDVIVIVPIVGVTFQKCQGGACAGALSISPDSWKSAAILQTAKTIVQSLVIE